MRPADDSDASATDESAHEAATELLWAMCTDREFDDDDFADVIKFGDAQTREGAQRLQHLVIAAAADGLTVDSDLAHNICDGVIDVDHAILVLRRQAVGLTTSTLDPEFARQWYPYRAGDKAALRQMTPGQFRSRPMRTQRSQAPRSSATRARRPSGRTASHRSATTARDDGDADPAHPEAATRAAGVQDPVGAWPARTRAIEILRRELWSGPRPTRVVEAILAEECLSERTLNRARSCLRVISERCGFGPDGAWWISLPAAGSDVLEDFAGRYIVRTPSLYGETQEEHAGRHRERVRIALTRDRRQGDVRPAGEYLEPVMARLAGEL